MISSQSLGMILPSTIAWPTGTCIQLLLARIQNDDNIVPSDTMQQAKKIEPRRARGSRPNSIDAEERRLQNERGERLVAEQRSLDRAGPLGEHAPVGAELERHDDAGDDTHAERHREDLEPEVEDPSVDGVAGGERHAFDRRQPRRQPDGERRKDDVKA